MASTRPVHALLGSLLLTGTVYDASALNLASDFLGDATFVLEKDEWPWRNVVGVFGKKQNKGIDHFEVHEGLPPGFPGAGCYMRMPSGCPKEPMRTQAWRRDTWASQHGLDEAGCHQRKHLWEKHCGSEDAEMMYVSRSHGTSSELAGSETSSEQMGNKTSAEQVNSETGSEQVGSETRSEQVGSETSSEQVNSETGSQLVNSETSSEQAGSETSSEQVGNETSSEQVGNETGTEQVGNKTSSEPASSETASEQVGSETSSEPASSEMSSKQVGNETSSEPASSEMSSKQVGNETSSEQVSRETSSEQVGGETSSKPAGLLDFIDKLPWPWVRRHPRRGDGDAPAARAQQAPAGADSDVLADQPSQPGAQQTPAGADSDVLADQPSRPEAQQTPAGADSDVLADQPSQPEAQQTPAGADSDVLADQPSEPGCYMRMPSGCPRMPMETHVWRHDAWAEQHGLDKAGCESRKRVWDKYCDAGDANVLFVPMQ